MRHIYEKQFSKRSRREFIDLSLRAGLLTALSGPILTACERNATSDDKTSRPLKILILGGTSYLGPHQIAYALDRGHTVTTFTRGKTKPRIHSDRFDQVDSLIGDRKDDLSALEGRKWDVVIDNSGRDVEWTRKSAELLKDSCRQYIYTSSIGVYYPYLTRDIKEDMELLLEEPEGIVDEEMKIEYWYGVMKANSELAAIAAFGKERTTVVRPTYMLGPGDPYDRFIYWPLSLNEEGPTIVPGRVDDPVQYIDVRDVAEWMIRLAESGTSGAFNAARPSETVQDFAINANEALGAKSDLIFIDDYAFLKENSIPYLVPWIMPEGNNYGSSSSNVEKAMAGGLTLRSLEILMNDTIQWWHSDAVTDERRQAYVNNEEEVYARESAIVKDWMDLKSDSGRK